MTLTAYRLAHGQYVQVVQAGPGTKVTIDAAPAPVTLDPADLPP